MSSDTAQGWPEWIFRKRLSCRPGDRIAARMIVRQTDACSKRVMGRYALAPEDVTEDFPVVIGTVRSADGRQGLAVLEEHGRPVFLAGARMVRKAKVRG